MNIVLVLGVAASKSKRFVSSKGTIFQAALAPKMEHFYIRGEPNPRFQAKALKHGGLPASKEATDVRQAEVSKLGLGSVPKNPPSP